MRMVLNPSLSPCSSYPVDAGCGLQIVHNLRLTTAYEQALRGIGLVDRNDPLAEMVAKKIIEIGQTGVRDPAEISALTIQELGVQ
jgi:hypothetical protein